MKNKIVILLILLLVIPLVTAQVETLGIFKQGNCLELKQTCGSCTFIKITSVLYPNSTIALASVNMSTTDGFEYSYPFCNTYPLGTYIVNGYGDVDGTNTVWAYDFEVSQTGSLNSSTPYILFSLIAIIVILMLVAFKFSQKAIKIFLVLLSFGLLIITVRIGALMIESEMILGLVQIFTNIMIWLFWLMITYFLLYYTIDAIKSVRRVNQDKKENIRYELGGLS